VANFHETTIIMQDVSNAYAWNAWKGQEGIHPKYKRRKARHRNGSLCVTLQCLQWTLILPFPIFDSSQLPLLLTSVSWCDGNHVT